MAQNRIFVLPLPVHDVLEGLAHVAGEALGDASTNLSVSSSIPQISWGDSGPAKGLRKSAGDFLKRVGGRTHLLCESASLHCTEPRVQLVYATDAQGTYFELREVRDQAFAFTLVDSLAKHFKLMTRSSVLAASLPKEHTDAIRFKEAVLGDLTAQVSRLGVFLTEMAEKNSETIRTLSAELERKYEAKETELQARVRAQQDEVDAARKKFDQEKAAFDDRQRTHVRRDLLKKIQENIEHRKATPGISRVAMRTRWLLDGFIVIVLVASGVGAVVAGNAVVKAASNSATAWHLVPPFSACAVLFVSTLIFYLRWNSRWFDRLAVHDFAQEQYETDILRASWVAELVFEHKDEKKAGFPKEVAESFTQGLFAPTQSDRVNYHPSDDLAGFLRKIQTIKAGPSGVEITKNKRGSALE